MNQVYDEADTYDRAAQLDALRLIVEKCPRLAGQAADAMNSQSDAARQMRLDRLVPQALRAAAADMDAEQRAQLAAAMHGGRPGQ